MPMKLVYYDAFTGRANAVVKMLAEAKIEYETVMDEAACSCKGSETATAFAPPIIIDGDKTIGQSVALSSYIGKKCGFDKAVADPDLALQYMCDANDVLDEVFKKKTAGFKDLKAFLEEGRLASWLGNMERCIKGPFYFGDQASYVDYHVAATLQMPESMGVADLPASGNVFAKYPKLAAVMAAINGSASAKAIGKPVLPEPYVITAEQKKEYAEA